MDVNVALSVLLALLNRAGEFAAAIKKARAEGRDLTPEEIKLAGADAQAALDSLGDKLDAPG
jgi:hypothetical protein